MGKLFDFASHHLKNIGSTADLPSSSCHVTKCPGMDQVNSVDDEGAQCIDELTPEGLQENKLPDNALPDPPILRGSFVDDQF